jgi:hypothetical protein
MPDGIIIVIGLLILAIVVAIVLPLAQKAAADPFVDVPPDRAQYIEDGAARYNRFSDTNDVTKGNFLRTVDPGRIATGNADLAEVSRTSDLTPDPTAPTRLGIEGTVPSLAIPPPNQVLVDAKRCEAVKGRGACVKLGTDALKGCGVCIKKGTTYFDPDNPGKHIGGLTLLAEDRAMAEDEATGTGKAPVYMPTVGECPDGFFFVDRAACEKESRRLNCKEVGETGGFDGGRTDEGRVIGEAECAAVPNAGPTTYIYDTKTRSFTINLRVLTPVRTGKTVVTVLNSAGATIASNEGEGGAEFVVPLKNMREGAGVKIKVDISEPYVPFTGASEYRAVLLQWDSTDGKRIGRVEPSIVSLNGQGRDADGIIKVLRNFGTYSRSSIILLPRPADNSKILTNTQWIWGAGGGRVLNIDAKIPGTFTDPVYSEDRAVAPTGPLITKKETFDLLRASPCDKPDQKPKNYSLSCLKNLFVSAGGSLALGMLSRDGLEKLNSIGDGSAETIKSYLDGLFQLATRGKNSSGMKASITEINDAAMKMFGFEIVTPCEDIYEDEKGEIGLIPKVGGLDADCLDFLWSNTGNDRSRGDEDRSRNTGIKNTYVSIGQRYSGLRAKEGTAAEVAAAPFATCQRTGTLAPKDKSGKINAEAVQLASGKGGVEAIQNFYNNVYKAANSKGGAAVSSAEHQTAMLQCYGIKRSGAEISEVKETCVKPTLLVIGKRISFSPASNLSTFARHAGFDMWTHFNDGSPLFRADSSFKVVAPLAGTPGAVSFEAVNFPGYYIAHMNYRIHIFPANRDWTSSDKNYKRRDAEWFVTPAKNGNSGQVSFENKNFPNHYITKNGDQLWLTQPNQMKYNDVSFQIKAALDESVPASAPAPVVTSGCLNLPKDFTPVQGTVLGNVTVSENYKLSFTILPRGLVAGWGSIIHFSVRDDWQNFGSRTPGIWFNPVTINLHVRIGDRTDNNFGFDAVPGLMLNKSSTVVIECKDKLATVTIDGVERQRLTQPTSRYKGSATVYGSSPWYTAANAVVSNLCYTALN